jgi:hypothetical protein
MMTCPTPLPAKDRILLGGICLVLLAVAAATSPEPIQIGYLGGSGTDDCDGVALDRVGDIYLGCHSDSPNFPGLPAKAPPQSNDDMDAVVVKIEARTGRILWATRTGGSSWDAAGDLEVAKDGSVYVLGSTRSADFPTTADAVQRKFGGPDRDVFLLRLDSRGRIVYSTLLGGAKNDEATALAVAGDGTVYIGGVTMSADFPGTRVNQFGPGGPPDAFIARLRPGDPKSLQTVLLGGKGREQISSLALDGSGNIFAAGWTASADFPVKNGLQTHLGGTLDAFVAKLRVADWSLLFSTYLGGSKMDGAYAIALDSSGNPIVSGVTASEDFVTTPGVFQPRRRGAVDAFVTKLDRDGTRVLWSTYYGGSKANSDRYMGGSMAVDGTGRVWLGGATNSPDLPTRNPHQATYGGGDFDGFLAAFSSDGSKLCYGSYVGGNGHDMLEGLAVGKGKVYASGISSSTNIRQKRWQVQAGFGGGPYDAILIGLDAPLDASCR